MLIKTVILLILLSSLFNGQVLGPEIPLRNFEIGFIQKCFHRDMGQISAWDIPSIYAKYGVHNRMTLSIEGFVKNINDQKFPDRDYRQYTIGGGITIYALGFIDFHITCSFHYNETFWFDRSESTYHKNSRGIIGAIQIERTYRFKDHSITFWLGPAYIFDEVIQNVYGDYNAVHDTSRDNFGAIFGANFTLFKHIKPFGHIVYADFLQPRFGIGYNF